MPSTVTRPRHRPIPHRWCYTHNLPLWVADTHYGLTSDPCDTSRVLMEVSEFEEARRGKLDVSEMQ